MGIEKQVNEKGRGKVFNPTGLKLLLQTAGVSGNPILKGWMPLHPPLLVGRCIEYPHVETLRKLAVAYVEMALLMSMTPQIMKSIQDKLRCGLVVRRLQEAVAVCAPNNRNRCRRRKWLWCKGRKGLGMARLVLVRLWRGE